MGVEFTLNGEACSLAKGCTLADLIEALDLSDQALTVKINKETMSRGAWQQVLQSQDAVEITLAFPTACVIDVPY